MCNKTKKGEINLSNIESTKKFPNYDFEIGSHANNPERPPLVWNPDAKETINPHLLICGGSGAGKTDFLKKLALYLSIRGKHVFMFDLKGDLEIKDEQGNKIGNYIEFTAWNSKWGINPFEFDTGVPETELQEIIDNNCNMNEEQQFKIYNSGPKVQVDRMIEIIKKTFLPNMGTAQKDILMYLLNDTYLSKNIVYNDITTWLNELPSLENVMELIEQLKVTFNVGVSFRNVDGLSADFINSIKELIVSKKELLDRIKKVQNKEESDIQDEEIDIEEVNKLIAEKDSLINDKFKEYTDEAMRNFTRAELEKIDPKKWFEERKIDISKYATKDAMRTVIKMASYINALIESGVFHSTRPPVKNGLNVFNISGLDVSIQRFVVDILLGKIFKACKIRGNYADRKDRSRGWKCDTYFMIDESKLVAGNSREKNDPYSYLNRTATEARGFGLGMIVAAQSAEHFPPEFLKNFDTQIVLKTGIADFDTVKKAFGLDKALLEFTQIARGNALVKTGRQFTKVKIKQRRPVQTDDGNAA